MESWIKLLCVLIGTFIIISVVDARSVKFPFRRIRKDACPKGFYYNHDIRRCQKLPCGGIAIFSDNTKRCSKKYLGIKVHPFYSQFYYICEKYSVTFVKCPENQIFNSTIRHCAYPPAQEQSVETDETSEKSCAIEGSSNCSLFYICDSNGKKTVKKVSGRSGNDGQGCFGQELNPDDYFIDYDMDTFPLCKQPGRFRSPTDCSLYYTCSAKTYGKFFQTRYRCPAGTLYDIEKERCRHKDRVKCEYVTVEDIIDEYDKTHNTTDVDSDESDYEDHWETSTIDDNSSSTSKYTTDPSEPGTTEASSNPTETTASDTSTNIPTSTEPTTVTTSRSSSDVKDEVDDDDESSTHPSTNSEAETEPITVTTSRSSSDIKDEVEDYDESSTHPSTNSEAEIEPITVTTSRSSSDVKDEVEDYDESSTHPSTNSEAKTTEFIVTSWSNESSTATTGTAPAETTLTSSSEEPPSTLISSTDGFANDTESSTILQTTSAPCNGSWLNIEDQSIETLKVHVSKPLKLLINFEPKFSCKDCVEDKTVPQEEKRFKKEGKIAILNLAK